MIKNSLLEQENFWQIVRYLLDCHKPKKISSIAAELSISSWELNSYINFIAQIGVETKIHSLHDGERTFCIIEEDIENISIQFSLTQWLAFQAHFPLLSECQDSPYHQELKEVLMAAEFKYKEHDLFSPAETLASVLEEHRPSLLENLNVNAKEILSSLEEFILDGLVIEVGTRMNHILVYPHKIVFFDGELNLIGEGLVDKCLLRLPLAEIISLLEVNEEFQGQYSSIEIDEFVSSLRAMSENQVRLILKINSAQQFNIHFNKMFMEKPCLFTNPQGDFIWAASLEPNEDIYEWLCELGTHVEILDPSHFKLEFLKYCEDKLKKIA